MAAEGFQISSRAPKDAVARAEKIAALDKRFVGPLHHVAHGESQRLLRCGVRWHLTRANQFTTVLIIIGGQLYPAPSARERQAEYWARGWREAAVVAGAGRDCPTWSHGIRIPL